MKQFVFTTDVRSPVHGDFKRNEAADKAVDKAWLESMVEAGYAKHVEKAPEVKDDDSVVPTADALVKVSEKKTKKK